MSIAVALSGAPNTDFGRFGYDTTLPVTWACSANEAGAVWVAPFAGEMIVTVVANALPDNARHRSSTAPSAGHMPRLRLACVHPVGVAA